MDKKGWIVFGVIVIALFGGLIALSGKNHIDVSGIDPNAIIAASDKNGNIADHVFGKANSKVMLVEYGDFQCPGCGNAYPMLKALSEKYKGQIAFVFRNFPLSSLHPNARAAAAAAEAAGLMGKYWEMHNTLYENQNNWNTLNSTDRTNAFVNYAKGLGLDETTFKDNMEKATVNQKISFDQAIGKKVGVDATPTIVLDGKKLDQNALASQDSLDALIQAAMKDNGISLPKSDSKK